MAAIEFTVGPGVISALLFIFLDIFTVGILDMVLSRIVCLSYYRNINEGRPVSVNSADIPGLSNYLLGRWMSPTNLIAVSAKIALLLIVLTANMSIKSKATFTHYEQRTGVFELAPSDEQINKTIKLQVQPRFESSKSCFKEDEEKLIYYELRFNLASAEDSIRDIQDIDDSTVVCMSDGNVADSAPLATVLGCSRNEDKPERSCLSVISADTVKSASQLQRLGTNSTYPDGEIVHTYVDFEQSGVDLLWKEYTKPLLTCLSTSIGIDSYVSPSQYTHCLMVSHHLGNTYVERWIMGPDTGGSNSALADEGVFILEYPGVIFEGKINFGREASARYLQLPFPFADYRTLSGELVAQASYYKEDKKTIGILKSTGDDNTITTIDIFAVVLVAASIVIVLVGYVVTILLLRRDNRPRFNTINGLSSIVREEHIPSGRSYASGDSAILGLRFTSNDNLHFGPLRDRGEGTSFQDGYDIS